MSRVNRRGPVPTRQPKVVLRRSLGVESFTRGRHFRTWNWKNLAEYSPLDIEVDTISGEIKAHETTVIRPRAEGVVWLRWDARPTRAKVRRREVTFVKYLCRVEWLADPQVVEYGGPGSDILGSISGFIVTHRLEEGALVLAAKVLACASVQPGWDRYQHAVENEWTK